MSTDRRAAQLPDPVVGSPAVSRWWVVLPPALALAYLAALVVGLVLTQPGPR